MDPYLRLRRRQFILSFSSFHSCFLIPTLLSLSLTLSLITIFTHQQSIECAVSMCRSNIFSFRAASSKISIYFPFLIYLGRILSPPLLFFFHRTHLVAYFPSPCLYSASSRHPPFSSSLITKIGVSDGGDTVDISPKLFQRSFTFHPLNVQVLSYAHLHNARGSTPLSCKPLSTDTQQPVDLQSPTPPFSPSLTCSFYFFMHQLKVLHRDSFLCYAASYFFGCASLDLFSFSHSCSSSQLVFVLRKRHAYASENLLNKQSCFHSVLMLLDSWPANEALSPHMQTNIDDLSTGCRPAAHCGLRLACHPIGSDIANDPRRWQTAVEGQTHLSCFSFAFFFSTHWLDTATCSWEG